MDMEDKKRRSTVYAMVSDCSKAEFGLKTLHGCYRVVRNHIILIMLRFKYIFIHLYPMIIDMISKDHKKVKSCNL